MRTTMALLLMATVAAASPGEVDRRLETKVSLHLRKARLSDALSVFRSATGLNFVSEDGADPEISIVVNDLSARSALRLILAPREMTAAFENGAVVIRNRRCLAGGTVLRIYDVRALQVKLPDFPGPRMGLAGHAGISFG